LAGAAAGAMASAVTAASARGIRGRWWWVTMCGH
jgi:hypothetical protein